MFQVHFQQSNFRLLTLSFSHVCGEFTVSFQRLHQITLVVAYEHFFEDTPVFLLDPKMKKNINSIDFFFVSGILWYAEELIVKCKDFKQSGYGSIDLFVTGC